MYTKNDLSCAPIRPLRLGYPAVKPQVPAHVYQARFERLRRVLKEKGFDAMVIYADREHYANFRYYAGVDPRFEEALLFLYTDGRAFAALGNECHSLAAIAGIDVKPVLCQMFSLPNQPMDQFRGIDAVMADCGLRRGMRIACVDWKLITPRHSDGYRHMYAMPAYLIDAITAAVGDPGLLSNETALLIDPGYGLRVSAEAEAIAEFEFGAAVASQACVDMMNAAHAGMSELELAAVGKAHGQVLSCHEYVVAGPNPRRGLISPSSYVLQPGDDIVVSMGIEGGLTCRRAALSYDGRDMSGDPEHYMEEIVKPYMACVFNWFEMMGIGVRCGDIFDMVQSAFPKEKYGWTLNPGHLIGYEEWMSSPFYKGSDVVIRSGMMFQMDIIPGDPEYITPNAEDGLAIADEALRAELAEKFPEVYARIQARREFVETQIGIRLRPEVLPLSNCFGEYRPYMLCRDKAITVKRH